jgi:hypothetical protein
MLCKLLQRVLCKPLQRAALATSEPRRSMSRVAELKNHPWMACGKKRTDKLG